MPGVLQLESLEARRLLAASPVALYTFEEGSGGSTADNSGTGNNGSLLNGATFGQGLIARYSMSFNGTSAYAQAPNSSSLNPTSAITVAAWINPTDWNGNRRIIQKSGSDNQYRLLAQSDKLHWEVSGPGFITTELPATGQWHHVAGTYDGAMIRLYIDGQLITGASASGSIFTTGEPLYIGTKNGGAPDGDHFSGRIDDLRIYNVALSDQEIALLAGITSINFQPAASTVPPRYLVDSGDQFGDRGNGLSYGWDIDHTNVVRDRDVHPDQRLDTLVQVRSGGEWGLALPDGSYEVIASVGDPQASSTNTLRVEGVTFASAVSLGANQFQTYRQTVTVNDGRLTIDNGSAANGATRINYVQVRALEPEANTAPATPTITEPSVDGQVANPADVHMEAPAFFDADGDTHFASDWEIRRADNDELVWLAYSKTGVERVHLHLGDGEFSGSHAGRVEMRAETDYVLRVRHRDSRGATSAFAQRLFSTGPRSSIAPLDLADVVAPPAPSWNVELPVGTSMTLGGVGGEVLMKFLGLLGAGNITLNPPSLGTHVHSRIVIDALTAALTLPITDLTFSDDTGESHTIYLPAVALGVGESAYFWIGADGSSYAGTGEQLDPDFETPARLAPIPFVASQSGYVIDRFATGFQLPVNIAFVPNPGPDPDDVFFYVTELYGTIKAVTRDGTLIDYATDLLNFNPTGDFPGSGEQGLSGLVVDPASGDVFASMVYSSVPGAEPVPHYPRIVRFHSTDGGQTAATQTTVISMPGETMGQSHFISNLSFGPDGKLYVHVGDGFDPSTSQNLNSFRGKVLRMNLDGTAATGNPFFNSSDGITARDYVYAYGLRNPFAGGWRAADGKHYEAENGPSIDRLAQVVPGRNYLYNGTDQSMTNFAIYNWNPAHAPVNLLFVQNGVFGGSGFPASKLDHLFISESGPTWATGPQNLGKRITEFTLDANGNRLSGPIDFVRYVGAGKGSVVALAAGPDGLYFSELYKDLDYESPIDQGARIFRVRYIGGTPPAVTVTPLTTSDPTPPLSGTVSDPAATIQVSVAGKSFAAVNNGDGTWSLANNLITPALPDGTYDVQVSATNAFGTTGHDSTAAELTIDTIAPQIISSQFVFDSPLISHMLSFVFSEDVSASLSVSDLQLPSVPAASIALDYDASTNTARFTFTGFAAGILPDANYRATLAAGSVADALGHVLSGDHVLDFFVLAGDANRDRAVNITDLGILASNWQKSPRTFSLGDFDYNGVVNITDLGILASNWQTGLALPSETVKKPAVRPRRLIDQINLGDPPPME